MALLSHIVKSARVILSAGKFSQCSERRAQGCPRPARLRAEALQSGGGGRGAPAAQARKLARFLVALSISLTCVLSAQVFRGPDLKALFLYNFAQFVDWPKEALPTSEAPLTIGVLSQELVAKALDDLTRNEAGPRRKLAIQRYRKVSEIQNCHILFIDQSQRQSLNDILEKVHGKPVLTVSDMDGFARTEAPGRRSGMIQLITEEGKIRLRIHVSAAKAANLTISSKLLKLAEIVE